MGSGATQDQISNKRNFEKYKERQRELEWGYEGGGSNSGSGLLLGVSSTRDGGTSKGTGTAQGSSIGRHSSLVGSRVHGAVLSWLLRITAADPPVGSLSIDGGCDFGTRNARRKLPDDPVKRGEAAQVALVTGCGGELASR